jgi:hypothetical protein
MEETYVTVAMVTIGLGAVATGIVGMVALPRGEQLSCLLALVVGAGIGIASLFVLMNTAPNVETEDPARLFMIAAFLGLGGVVASLAALIARSRRDARPARPSEGGP